METKENSFNHPHHHDDTMCCGPCQCQIKELESQCNRGIWSPLTLPFIMVYVWTTFIFVAMFPFLAKDKYSTGQKVYAGVSIGVFNVFFILTVWSWIKTVSTSPGHPASEAPRGESCCPKCHGHKPDRSHHCRICDRCVLKMDHHCPWVYNCVGEKNYKYFFLFVQYTELLSILSLLLLLGRYQWDGWDFEPSDAAMIPTVACLVLIGLILIGLSLNHCFLITKNMTTIEIEAKLREGGRQQPILSLDLSDHPYDHGCCNNMRSVLGSNICCWCFPVSSSTISHETLP